VKPLNDFQKYLLEEFVEEWREGHMTRRDMVKRAVYLTGGTASAATALLSVGCTPAAPTAAPTKPAPAATTAPAVTTAPAAAPTTAPTMAPTAAAAATKPAAAATGAASPAAAATAAASPAATKPAAAAASPAAGATGAASPAAGATGAAATKPAAGATAGAAPAGTPPPPATSTPPRSPLSVKEDDPAIEARMIDFPGEAGKVFGYFARPKAAGTYPAVVVIHENRGLIPHIQDVVRRAAKEGFVALGVDLLSRNGGTQAVGDDARASGLLGQGKPEDFVADLSAGVKYLQGVDVAKKDKLGVFGFCFGGGYTWRLAVSNKAITAAVPFYGPPPPLEQIPNTNAAILAIYGETDARINASIPQVEDALKKAGKTYEIKVYPGVGHAFHNDTGAAWNEQAALDAWKNNVAWLKKYTA
jgi:carboxymethylenebutenolidase